MPVDKQVRIRYQVLNRCFRDLYKKYTIDDLVDACNAALRNQDRAEVSKRTIQNDITNMEAEYGLRFEENLYQGKKRIYRYYDTSYTLPEFQLDDADRNKIQAAVNVLENYAGEPVLDWARTLLKQIESGMFYSDSSPVVSFQSNPDLKNISLFGDLLDAIYNKKVLKLTYTPFGKDSYEERVYPYHLKQFNDRWYLIAQAVGYEYYGHYALDRIDHFEEVDFPNYKESEVNFEEYFDDVIGVTVPEDHEPVDVILSVSNSRFHYIDTKPLHLSQRILGKDESHTRISINVKINKELISLLLSFGADLEVLAPASLRQMIAKAIRAMNQKYPDDEE
ncbi:MAG: WYL domain-containing protein [Prevotella sp.]|nr:WYL domain-containing protein [Prevotella sp.]